MDINASIIDQQLTGILDKHSDQTAGYKGADKRLDVLATASAAKLTVNEISEECISYFNKKKITDLKVFSDISVYYKLKYVL